MVYPLADYQHCFFIFLCNNVSGMYRKCIAMYRACISSNWLLFYNSILHQTECHCVSTFRGSCSSRFIFLGSCFTSVSGACHFISNDRLINQCSERCITIPLYPWKCFFVFPLEGTLFPFSGFLFPGVSKMFFCDSFCFQQEFRVPLEVKYHITIIPSQTVFCVHTWRTSVQISGVLFSVVHKTVFWCSVCFQNSIYVSKLDSSLLIYAIFRPGCYSLHRAGLTN